jgi:hypothetical protein
MDYYQGVVREFLQLDRSIFIHEELVIDLDFDENRPQGKNLKGRHWICDLAALSQKEKTLYLGEVTYSKSLQSIISRFDSWSQHWPDIVESLMRDSGIDRSWQICPWAFIPKKNKELFREKINKLPKIGLGKTQMPNPKMTFLEEVVPWKSKNWKGRPTSYSLE